MESIAGTATRSSRKARKPKTFESVQLAEKFHQLMSAPPDNASSFTAQLGLLTPQAVELLHSPESANLIANDTYKPPHFSHDNCCLNLEKPVKSEPMETEPSQPLIPNPTVEKKSVKRKDSEKKAKKPVKMCKTTEVGKSSGDAEPLPYIHVRVRRGQATDSHSLAERARREKINARMKLLQELVPGCNKISGTALVLDEIINHVQSLQHQVESLSMRLAASNQRIDFYPDSAFHTEGASLMGCNFPGIVTPPTWSQVQVSGNRQQYQQQWHFDTLHHHQAVRVKEEACHDYIIPGNSFLSHDSSANSGR